MDNCRSKRQILILDCCNSGAFARGTKGEQKAVTESTFEGSGSGRVVLTASNSTQFAFEGDQLIKQSELSLFTHFLLEGLKTGGADRNNDGRISLEEWYEYSYTKIVTITPQQIPHKWSYNQQGDLVIAQNPFVKKRSALSLASPLRAMLDQKQRDYHQHKLLLNSKELEIVAEDLKHAEQGLTDVDKQLLLFSGLAQRNAKAWLEISGVKGLEWLRQACLDESVPQEVRWGAATHLGKMEDEQTIDLLLSCSQQELDRARRGTYLDLMTAYLNSSELRHHLPWKVRRTIFPRLARLRIKEAAVERARISQVAAYLAPVCVLITYASIMFVPAPTISTMTAISGAIFSIITGVILAITFAQVMTSLTSITYGLPILGRALTLVGAGSAFGYILFLVLASYIHVWFAGGIIGLVLAMIQPARNKNFAVSVAGISALLVFTSALFVLETKTSVKNVAGYAFSVSLFVGTYVFQHIHRQRLLE